MDFYRITYSVQKRIARITLNWPEKNNSLDDQMVSELIQAFTQTQRDPQVSAVILRAEGDSFCAGIDPAYIQRIAKYDFSQNLQDSTDLMKLFQQIYTLRKPVIALVQGPATAGGCGLISVCDFIIAAHETATFGYTEAQIGFIPAIVLIFLVRRIGEGRARELVLKGNIINAEEALKVGLVNKTVPAIELEKTGLQLANELITKNSGTSMGLIKELLARVHGMATNDALEYASHLNALTRMTDDCKKGMDAFLNSKQNEW
ncbi:MAG: enoyl-CoA hydratase/isomerase family protein [Bacteroidetes bacterium]|nr:enoyl-CoA hydratase/isomerase family protein [Bacteroidota bacterium]